MRKTHPTKPLLLAIAFLIPASVFAATFTVINTNDSGAGSLRQALISANANPIDADNIVFDIPLSDPNYDSATGVFTITPTSLLPIIYSMSVSVDGTTQTIQSGNTNPKGPEICIRSNSALAYCFAIATSGCTLKGFILNGFSYAISLAQMQGVPSGNCTVSDCYIGINHDGTAAAPNVIGIAALEAGNNSFLRNLISGNSTAGIALRRSDNNLISGNKIGTDAQTSAAVPNYYGVALDSSSHNTIGGNTAAQRNVISGNSYAGVAVNAPSAANTIKGNYIGTNDSAQTRTDTLPNKYGIALNESAGNTIGGAAAGERNIISGNREAGIALMGMGAAHNRIIGNYIGTTVSGTDSLPNANGIIISSGTQNSIGGANPGEGNVLSGNSAAGVIITYSGARQNTIQGNFIGTSYDGTAPLGNHTGIYIKSNANKNTVGGTTAGARNIISGNIEMGLIIEAADSNRIIGNYIGPDVSGMQAFKFPNDTLIQANGLMFNTGAQYNIAGGYTAAERNVISGNRIYGHDIYGNSSYNLTIGNYIGVDATGSHALPNATGICVDGGSNHNPFINNVLSGNLAYGMFIVTTGSEYNELKGNKIGTDASGTAAVPNQVGFLFGGGAKHNTVGGTDADDRNIISGNTFSGIEMADAGTAFNNIIGNYIGTDISGTTAIPNLNGIGLTTHAGNNNLSNNVISGNLQMGIILYEHSDSNTVFGNLIGVATDSTTPLPNSSAGIVITNNSSYNKIGAPGKGNIIAHSDTAGIVIAGAFSQFNTLSANRIFGNALMDIDLAPFGVNVNDAGDADLGANEGMNYPLIQSATYEPGTGVYWIKGQLDCLAHGGPEGIRIELFQTEGGNPFQHGGATKYLGYTTVSDSAGNWEFIGQGANSGGAVTATATDAKGNTSELANNYDLLVSTPHIATDKMLSIYPNPASDKVTLAFSLVHDAPVTARLLPLTGAEGMSLFTEYIAAGKHLRQLDLRHCAAGFYLLEVIAGKEVLGRAKLTITP